MNEATPIGRVLKGQCIVSLFNHLMVIATISPEAWHRAGLGICGGGDRFTVLVALHRTQYQVLFSGVYILWSSCSVPECTGC